MRPRHIVFHDRRHPQLLQRDVFHFHPAISRSFGSANCFEHVTKHLVECPRRQEAAMPNNRVMPQMACTLPSTIHNILLREGSLPSYHGTRHLQPTAEP